MKLTGSAIAFMKEGARSGLLDTNAICYDGKVFYAGQIKCADNQELRKRLVLLDEYQPVLEVRELIWLGTRGKFPKIKLIVTDGIETMEMQIGFRNPERTAEFFRKKGPLFSGKLNIGKRFRLLDYTTQLDDSGSAIVFMERMRAAPKKVTSKTFASMLKSTTSLDFLSKAY
jgi:hypothetical protein